MAKVSVQHVTDAGFRADQFGTPADFTTTETGYIARVIADAAVWAASRVGQPAYDAADGIGALRLRNAELCYVKHVLWGRRVAFIDSNASQSLDNSGYLNRREYAAQAANARECMDFWITEFTTDGNAEIEGSMVTSGFAETGRFPPSRTELTH